MFAYTVAILLAGVGAIGLVACMILFIVGLATRRKRLWQGALVGLAAAIILGVLGMGWCAALLWGDGRSFIADVREERKGNDKNARLWFESGTGLKLPDGAKYLAGRDYSGWLSAVYMQVQVPPEFAAVLDRELGRATGGVEMRALTDVARDMPNWDRAVRTEGMLCYTKQTGSADTGGFTASIALDPKTGVMYCLISEFAP